MSLRCTSTLSFAMAPSLDRKSTRLNSSHTVISYAVFCLKKKKKSDNAMLNVDKYLSACASVISALLLLYRGGIPLLVSLGEMLLCLIAIVLFFFFNDTATTEIYTLSLHDALPI